MFGLLCKDLKDENKKLRSAIDSLLQLCKIRAEIINGKDEQIKLLLEKVEIYEKIIEKYERKKPLERIGREVKKLKEML